MESVRSGGDLENICGNGKYSKDIIMPRWLCPVQADGKETWQ